LALIQSVCDIKRNFVGFFSPHSSDEFKAWLKTNNLTPAQNVHFSNSDLQDLDKGKIESLVNQTKLSLGHNR